MDPDLNQTRNAPERLVPPLSGLSDTPGRSAIYVPEPAARWLWLWVRAGSKEIGEANATPEGDC